MSDVFSERSSEGLSSGMSDPGSSLSWSFSGYPSDILPTPSVDRAAGMGYYRQKIGGVDLSYDTVTSGNRYLEALGLVYIQVSGVILTGRRNDTNDL